MSVICVKTADGYEHPRDWMDLWQCDQHALHHEVIRLRLLCEAAGIDWSELRGVDR